MIKKLSVDDVANKLELNKSLILLEALPEKYFKQGHIPGAYNVPHDAAEADIKFIVGDKEAEIITYCANGPCMNSEILAERLIEMGFNNVSDFHLGKEGWVKSGRHLVK